MIAVMIDKTGPFLRAHPLEQGNVSFLPTSLWNLSSAVPELWFGSSGGVSVCVHVCREPLYL